MFYNIGPWSFEWPEKQGKFKDQSHNNIRLVLELPASANDWPLNLLMVIGPDQ